MGCAITVIKNLTAKAEKLDDLSGRTGWGSSSLSHEREIYGSPDVWLRGHQSPPAICCEAVTLYRIRGYRARHKPDRGFGFEDCCTDR